jgi:hypothetical protein
LSRWLLKVCYNDARVTGRAIETHKPYIPFILGRATEPPLPTQLFMGLVEPVAASPDELRRNAPSVWSPGAHKVGFFVPPVVTSDVQLARFVGLNSYLLRSSDGAPTPRLNGETRAF